MYHEEIEAAGVAHLDPKSVAPSRVGFFPHCLPNPRSRWPFPAPKLLKCVVAPCPYMALENLPSEETGQRSFGLLQRLPPGKKNKKEKFFKGNVLREGKLEMADEDLPRYESDSDKVSGWAQGCAASFDGGYVAVLRSATTKGQS